MSAQAPLIEFVNSLEEFKPLSKVQIKNVLEQKRINSWDEINAGKSDLITLQVDCHNRFLHIKRKVTITISKNASILELKLRLWEHTNQMPVFIFLDSIYFSITRKLAGIYLKIPRKLFLIHWDNCLE